MSAFPVSRSRRTHGAFGKRLAVWSLAGILVAGALAPLDAEAKRMGGNRSFGRQTQMAPSPSQSPSVSPTSPSSTGAQRAQQAQPAQQNAATATPAPAAAAAAAQPRNRWLGPLAGIAAGLGIGALLSHFGLGEGLAQMLSNLLLIGLVVVAGLALFRFIARKRRPDLAYPQGQTGTPHQGDFARAAEQASQTASRQPSHAGYSSTHGFATSGAASGMATPALSATASSANASSLRSAAQNGAVPAGFDTEGFVRTSKVSFVRLQAAWDKGDQGDIYEFTTPEMFAEVKMDLEARGKQANRTDVVELDAQLLGVEEHGSEQLASVRFHGLIRESESDAAQPFEEVWNFVRDNRSDSAWRLAGIQQIA